MTEHVAVAPEPDRVQVVELNVPEPLGDCVKVTVPVGVTAVPELVSVTVAVHVVAWLTATVAGEQDTLVVVVRRVTVKVAEAASPLASVAVTVLEPLDKGTTKVAENEPTEFVVTVAGVVVCIVPLNVIVIVEVPAKPVPETVTVVPTGPVVGLSVIEGVTVNVAEAVLALASVAVTV